MILKFHGGFDKLLILSCW